MRERSAGELAGPAGARLVGDPAAVVGPDVVIDSRRTTPGSLFVALPGEHADGHDFAERAVDAGAGALLVTRQLPLDVPQLVVPDAAAALAALGTVIAAEGTAAGMVTVGITGSSGKTSTKDLLAQVLAAAGETVAPEGSFNNEIGVPLTATRVTPATRFLVSELGARGLGHITWLCGIVPPTVGVVVNVGHAHLGEFGSVEAIAQAKGELVEAVPATGWAVLNADDPLVTAMATRTPAHLAAFSATGEPEWGDLRVWASGISADARQRPSFTLHATTASGPDAAARPCRGRGRAQPGHGHRRRRGGAQHCGVALALADGARRAARRRAGGERRLQRQSRFDGGRVAHAGLPAPARRPAAGRPRRHARTRSGRTGRSPGDRRARRGTRGRRPDRHRRPLR
jgi:UDP-N-acetylmuramoyl-tripeptide--D-alanyl-D-alanine ligase